MDSLHSRMKEMYEHVCLSGTHIERSCFLRVAAISRITTVWNGGLKFGSVHISAIFMDDTFTFVACVRSKSKHTHILSDMSVKRSCFLEWPECHNYDAPEI